MNGSAMRICNTALAIPDDHLVIFLAHNGPTGTSMAKVTCLQCVQEKVVGSIEMHLVLLLSGLGSNINDICGKDRDFGGGNHGDPDLAQAIAHLKDSTKLNITLVVFGQMHKELAYGNGLRKMIVAGGDEIIYLNGAIVPRVRRTDNVEGTTDRSFSSGETSQCRGTQRAFTTVDIVEGKVDKIAEVWVYVSGDMTFS